MTFKNIFLITLIYFHTLSTTTSNKRFGPFYIVTHSISSCRMTKIEEAVKMDWKLNSVKTSRTKEDIQGYTYISKNLTVDSANIVGEELGNGGFKPYFKISLKKPCTYNVFKRILKHVYSTDEKSCFIKMGNYSVHDINADMVVHWWGSNNFYSRQTFEVSYGSPKVLMFCMRIAIDSKPLN